MTPKRKFGRPSQARSRVRVYTVHAEGRTDSGAVFVREAVVRMVRNSAEAFRFHAWRQGRRRLFEDLASDREG